MALPPQNHRIPLADAVALTRRHRQQSPKPAINAGAFQADQVRELLDQKGVVAVRIYYGKDPAGKETLILVGVDANDKDMTGGVLLEFNYPCPPFCDDGSALNG